MSEIAVQHDSAAASTSSSIFVSDASLDAEQIVIALRARGYAVLEVPLGRLEARVKARPPGLILCDADQLGAVEAVRYLLTLPDCAQVHVMFWCEPRGTGRGLVERWQARIDMFLRPLNVQQILARIDELLGPPVARDSLGIQASLTPHTTPSSAPGVGFERRLHHDSQWVRARAANHPSRAPAADGQELAALSRFSSAPVPNSVTNLSLSPDLRALLSSAERRVHGTFQALLTEPRLSPEAELDALLPEDWLGTLEDSLESDEEEDPESEIEGTGVDYSSQPGTNRPGAAEVQEALPEPHSQAASKGLPSAYGDATLEPAKSIYRPVTEGSAGIDEKSIAGQLSEPAPREQVSTKPPRPTAATRPATIPPEVRAGPEAAGAPKPSTPLLIPNQLREGDSVRVLGQAILHRFSGALAFEDAQGVRRVVLRDGDFLTLASSAEHESLVSFLTERGDLPAEVGAKLLRKLPQFGRHSGAALVAQGYLRQDDLWNVLRAHAEWLLQRVVLLASGAASLEKEVPVRLRAEPGVFGGATGAEVFVEIVRRALSPQAALQRLGGRGAGLQVGSMLNLLGECALPDSEAQVIRQAEYSSVGQLLDHIAGSDFSAGVYALVELGVLRTARARAAAQPAAPAPAKPQPDEAALCAKIRDRRRLVDEADYFTILGVGRSATDHDVRQAHAALRREFDPAAVAPTRTPALRADLELIVEILDEAYDVLRDPLRRERYRRALDATPSAKGEPSAMRD